MLLYLPLAMSVENDKQSSECFHYLFSFRAGAAVDIVHLRTHFGWSEIDKCLHLKNIK